MLDRVTAGEPPDGHSVGNLSLKYDPPEFNSDWPIQISQSNIDHVLRDSQNRARLEKVFGAALGGKFNDHLAFRAVYGELQLQSKEGIAIPQWFHEDYQFIMPLFLTQSDHVELTAALQAQPAMKRYLLRTLLFPEYAYAHSRAIVESRASFAGWMMLTEDQLSRPVEDLDEADEAELGAAAT